MTEGIRWRRDLTSLHQHSTTRSLDGGVWKSLVKGGRVREGRWVMTAGMSVHSNSVARNAYPVMGFCWASSKAKEMRPEMIWGRAINLQARSSSFCRCLNRASAQSKTACSFGFGSERRDSMDGQYTEWWCPLAPSHSRRACRGLPGSYTD